MIIVKIKRFFSGNENPVLRFTVHRTSELSVVGGLEFWCSWRDGIGK
jgi:hypothetical protein